MRFIQNQPISKKVDQKFDTILSETFLNRNNKTLGLQLVHAPLSVLNLSHSGYLGKVAWSNRQKTKATELRLPEVKRCKNKCNRKFFKTCI